MSSHGGHQTKLVQRTFTYPTLTHLTLWITPMCLLSLQETVQKLLDAARSGGFQAVQQAVGDLIAEGWLVRPFCVPPCHYKLGADVSRVMLDTVSHCKREMPEARLPVPFVQMQSVLLEVQSAVLSDDTLRDDQRAKACSAVALADKVRTCTTADVDSCILW